MSTLPSGSPVNDRGSMSVSAGSSGVKTSAAADALGSNSDLAAPPVTTSDGAQAAAAQSAMQGLRRARPYWFWTGAVLWGFVALGMFWLYQERARKQQRPAGIPVAGTADETPSQPTTPSEPMPLPVITNANGEQVIDLSQLGKRPAQDPADINDSGVASVSASTWVPAPVADFQFINCDGRTISRDSLLGRPWAICFVFTNCLGPCPTVTRQMKHLQDRLRDTDLRLVTLTVDPVRDTPEALLKYAKLNGADLERWYFLGGDQREIYQLIQGSFKMPVQETTGADRQMGYEFIHTTNVMLVDAQGIIRGKFNAARDEDMAALRRGLVKLAGEATTSASVATNESLGPSALPPSGETAATPAADPSAVTAAADAAVNGEPTAATPSTSVVAPLTPAAAPTIPAPSSTPGPTSPAGSSAAPESAPPTNGRGQ
jgi:cytochrome oxidase Cu insertion factor (SCO1/SenC/PrrC family)